MCIIINLFWTWAYFSFSCMMFKLAYNNNKHAASVQDRRFMSTIMRLFWHLNIRAADRWNILTAINHTIAKCTKNSKIRHRNKWNLTKPTYYILHKSYIIKRKRCSEVSHEMKKNSNNPRAICILVSRLSRRVCWHCQTTASTLCIHILWKPFRR